MEKASSRKVEEWQNVYLSEEGSPNTTTAPATAIGPDATSSLSSESATASKQTPERPPLRKAKTLGDLLRRVPSSPGPPLPISPQKSTTKKAFAFTSFPNSSKSKLKSSNPDPPSSAPKEPKFTLSMRSSRHRSKSPEDRCRPGNWKSKNTEKSKERKRTLPYEAPYFWIPPDKAASMVVNRKDSSDSNGSRGRKAKVTAGTAGGVKSAPASRAVSPARNGDRLA
ncbi:hypothetical protein NMY22_g1958 [Coprinellus aureogranulatus]|nr:hypothetical protein NMY22_g1958 [Coprinellus aureogranulatus]